MTLLVLDVAAWQGALATADVVRAGFSAVNLKVSHGLSQKSVHPDIRGWITRARAAGLAISTFHYLDGSAPGDAQAAYAFGVLSSLGLASGSPHTVDCEADADEATLRAYVGEMTSRLGRPIAVYTGDWWWVPRGWTGSDLTPYLWAAPTGGYLSTYPGDTSPAWVAGWGGWPTTSALQYAVGPLSYPDGKAGTIDVSKSAVRDTAVWTALSGGGQVASQAYYDWVDDGKPWKFSRTVKAVGDKLRAHGYTVYYMGNDDHLKHDPPEDHTPFSATGWPGKSPYPFCVAMDIMPPAPGQKSKLTGQTLPSLAKLAATLRADKIAGVPGAQFVKYMNWEPEGVNTGPCNHDSWTPDYARRSSTDRGHNHVSGRTDYVNSAASDDYDLVARATGEEDLVTSQAEFTALLFNALQDNDVATRMRQLPWQYSGGGIRPGSNALGALNRVDLGVEALGKQLQAATDAEQARDAAMIAQVLGALANVQSGTDMVTVDELKQALTEVYGEAARRAFPPAGA